MFKNGMKILCQNQKDFDRISELAEKEGKKWPKPQIPRAVKEGEIISIEGNYMQHANKDDQIYDLREVIESSQLLNIPEKIAYWYQYKSLQGTPVMLGITPQMIRDYQRCEEETGQFQKCDKCSWGKLIADDVPMCENKETKTAVRIAERKHQIFIKRKGK